MGSELHLCATYVIIHNPDYHIRHYPDMIGRCIAVECGRHIYIT